MTTEPLLTSPQITQNTELWKAGNYPFAKDRIAKRYQAGELIRMFGPCSLVSTAQILDMLALIAPYVDLVRAPGEKPRTRPFDANGKIAFEGIGMPAAATIMAAVVQRHPQVLFASEIMTGDTLPIIAEHLGLAWVGSRTQEKRTNREIGAAAAEAQLPVMVKNPMTADLAMYLGMMENVWIGSTGTVPIMACLRGISSAGTDRAQHSRNDSNVGWVKVLKSSFPGMPIIIDPSHMPLKDQLKPDVVADTVLEAVEAGADGYLVELNTPAFPSITDPGTPADATLEAFEKRGLL